MPTRACAHALRSIRSRIARRLNRGGDGGFILLEAVISISLITVIMSAVGVEYVAGLASASHQRAQMTATQVADTAVEGLRALQPTDLLTGRDQTSVTSERDTLAAISTVSPWISADAGKLAYDPTVTTGGATAIVPTAAVARKPGVISYQVYRYLECAAVSTDHVCRSTATALNYIRAVVAVVWTQRGCPASTCAYVTSTLISADSDPQFDDNQPLPAAPKCQLPSTTQTTIEVGDTPSVQLTPKNSTGVPPFFWSEPATEPTGEVPLSSLGLTLSPAGLIGGTVATGATSKKTRVIVTDSFGGRTDYCDISWTVYPKLTFSTVPSQANLTTDSISNTAISQVATGGKPAYRFSDPNSTLPTGLSITTTGTISGTPSAGTYTVQLKVTDAANHSVTSNSFTWTITYPPIKVNNVPVDQNTTVGTAIAALPAVTATGGNGGPYTWNLSGLPSGVTFNSSQQLAGSPTTAGTYTVTVNVTDSVGNAATPPPSFKWNVYAAPTIGSLTAAPATEGQNVDNTVNYNCPNMNCTVTLTGNPDGIGLATAATTTNNTTTALTVTGNGTIHVTGKVQSTAVAGGNASAGYNPVVRIANPAGSSVQTAGVTWTIFAPPTVTGIPAGTVTADGASPSSAFSYTCPIASCQFVLSGSVPGIGLSTTVANASGNTVAANARTTLTVNNTSGTLYLNGLVNTGTGSGAGTTFTPTVTVTDSNSISATNSGSYTVYATPSASTPGVQPTLRVNDTPSQKIAANCVNNASCTVTITGQPAGIGLNTTAKTSAQTTTSMTVPPNGSVYLCGQVTGGAATYVITVSVTESGRTVSSVGVWTVS
jgi:type II secretory pathway pseudopilin PulG